MENHEKNIDDLFREELGGYTETPPPAVWESLQKKLAKAPQDARFSDRRIWYIAILCLILILSIPTVREITSSLLSGSKTVALNENAISTPSGTKAGIAVTENKVADNNNNLPSNTNQTENTTAPANTSNNNKESKVSETAINNVSDKSRTPSPGSKSFKKAQIIPNKKQQNSTASVTKTYSHNKHKSGGSNGGNIFDNTFGNVPGSLSKENTSSQPDQNIYNSSLSKPAPAEEQTNEATTTTDKPKENATTKPQSKNNNDATNKVTNKNEPKKMLKPKFNRWEAGVKAGYERGFDNDASKKAVVSPYLQYNLSPKFSIMAQPAFKYASLGSRRIGNAATYYKENNDSSVHQTGQSIGVHGLDGTVYFYLTPFHYSQTHDSIIKSSVIGGSYAEFEFPLLLKYRITKTFSVYGGVNIVYSKSVALKENTATFGHITRSYDSLEASSNINPTPIPANSVFTYTGTDISQYRSQYPTTTTDQLRVGYMLGFSYEFYKRWLFDGLIQQSNTNRNIQAGYNINSALSAPYFRFTLGYKLLK
jgi:hypothetical protein